MLSEHFFLPIRNKQASKQKRRQRKAKETCRQGDTHAEISPYYSINETLDTFKGKIIM